MRCLSLIMLTIIILPIVHGQEKSPVKTFLELGGQYVMTGYSENNGISDFYSQTNKHPGFRLESKFGFETGFKHLAFKVGVSYHKECIGRNIKAIDNIQFPIELKIPVINKGKSKFYFTGGVELEKSVRNKKVIRYKRQKDVTVNYLVGLGIEKSINDRNAIGFEIAHAYSQKDFYISSLSPGGAGYNDIYSTNSLRFGIKYYRLSKKYHSHLSLH